MPPVIRHGGVGYARPYPRPAAKPPVGCAVVRGAGATLSAFTACPHVAGQGLVRVRQSSPSRLLPDDSIVSLLYVLAEGASAEISAVGKDGRIGIALFMGGETTPSRAIAQTAVCNRHHSVEQHLCRWLLLLEYHRGWIITVLDRPKLERQCCECYAVLKKESDRLLSHPRPKPLSSNLRLTVSFTRSMRSFCPRTGNCWPLLPDDCLSRRTFVRWKAPLAGPSFRSIA